MLSGVSAEVLQSQLKMRQASRLPFRKTWIDLSDKRRWHEAIRDVFAARNRISKDRNYWA